MWASDSISCGPITDSATCSLTRSNQILPDGSICRHVKVHALTACSCPLLGESDPLKSDSFRSRANSSGTHLNDYQRSEGQRVSKLLPPLTRGRANSCASQWLIKGHARTHVNHVVKGRGQGYAGFWSRNAGYFCSDPPASWMTRRAFRLLDLECSRSSKSRGLRHEVDRFSAPVPRHLHRNTCWPTNYRSCSSLTAHRQIKHAT